MVSPFSPPPAYYAMLSSGFGNGMTRVGPGRLPWAGNGSNGSSMLGSYLQEKSGKGYTSGRGVIPSSWKGGGSVLSEKKPDYDEEARIRGMINILKESDPLPEGQDDPYRRFFAVTLPIEAASHGENIHFSGFRNSLPIRIRQRKTRAPKKPRGAPKKPRAPRRKK